MNDILYDLMDWSRIEALVYSEEDQPHEVLGAHLTDQGVLIQAFWPGAENAQVITEEKTYDMEKEDETGFFAALLPGKTIPSYRLRVSFSDDDIRTLDDPYRFGPVLSAGDLRAFSAGICYDLYEKLGAHPMTIDGVSGVLFAVWAPNAVRVSVVGDFNHWDGRMLPMRRLPDYGVFELFVPGIAEGTIYKFEIKAKGGLTFLKADPFAFGAELRPNTASVVTGLSGFEWTDGVWMEERKKADYRKSPLLIYEFHPGSFKKPDDGREFFNYRELAPMLCAYVKQMGYTHVEMMPVMEHPLDETGGYQTSGYYAPTARYGSARDFMCFVNYLHAQGIGLILDWDASHFPRDTFGLCGFDGTCLYEHQDPRQGVHPQLGTFLYNYGRPQVRNFLIANALFWNKVYHADGLRLNSVSAMLYLDYGKTDGQWVANMYGGNENLDAVEFLKHLSSVWHRQENGALLIAEETRAWPKVTAPLDEDGLGFDFKWNNGWLHDFLDYMELDPVFRGPHHGDLTFSLVYQYSEEFLLAMPHAAFTGGQGTLLRKMPGKPDAKYANYRAALGYMAVHPGKKLLFMGEDMAAEAECGPGKPLDWKLLEDEKHQQAKHYVSQLLKLIRKYPALYELDDDPDGFEWINNISANENMLVFLRKGTREEDMLLVVCNFSSLSYGNYKIGVPFQGKYKEIFNSDRTEFGGSGCVNPRVKNTKKDECDYRDYSIRIMVPPMGISIFSCQKIEKPVSMNESAKTAKRKKEAVKAAEEATAKTRRPQTGRKKVSLKDELSRRVAEEESR